MAVEPPADSAIWIAAPTGRCGSNYLNDLLALHPRCRYPAAPFHEHHFLLHSASLVRYAGGLQEHYERCGFEDNAATKARVLRALGDGLLVLVTAGVPDHERVLLKTPGMTGIENFHALFPHARPVVIVRDPRNTIQSLRTSFGGDLIGCAEYWRDHAQALIAYLDSGEMPCLVVHYETLYVRTRASLEAILPFLGLDPERYDFEAAEMLPVRGSSVFGRAGGALHWKPVPRTTEFDPLSRTTHWSDADHRLVSDITGEAMVRFGYDPGRRPLSFAELEAVGLSLP